MGIHEVQNKIKELFPEWHTQSEQYKNTIASFITPESVILDIGCGRTDYMADLYAQVKRVIGQDPDAQALAENPVITEKLVGDFEILNTLPDNSVDMIVSAWTLEHLPDADKLFIQIQRLLKPKGKFIALTPNRSGIPSIISRLIPNSLHPKIVYRLWGRAEENTYPTFYRLNNRKKIQKYCDSHNLTLTDIQYLKDPSYYIRRLKDTHWVYKIHRMFPKNISEGLLITITKPEI